MQASVALWGADDGLVFGSLEELRGDTLFIRALYPWDTSGEVSFRLELTLRGAWVSGRLDVRGVAEDRRGGGPVARCTIVAMVPEDRERFEAWSDELAAGGTSTHPNRWVETLSQVSDVSEVRRRSTFSSALRDRVRRMRQEREDSTDPGS